MKSVIAVVLASCWVSVVAAGFLDNCCEPHDDEHLGRICDDGSRAPLIGCCGNGPCNIMCCNCDNGCKSGKHKPYKLLGVWGASLDPNLGLWEPSASVDASKFLTEAVKTAAKEAGEGIYAIATAGDGKDESGIEYHPQRKQ